MRCGMASFIQRRTTVAAHHQKPMSDIQTLINNIEELKTQFVKSFETIESAVSLLQQQQQQQTNKINAEQTALKFVEFFSDELEKNISGGKLFAAQLNHIRQNFNKMYYQSLNYRELVNKPTEGWAKRRQLLLNASAIWRYTFHGRSCDLKSQIEAAMECKDCGQFVRPMVERMIQQKLWV